MRRRNRRTCWRWWARHWVDAAGGVVGRDGRGASHERILRSEVQVSAPGQVVVARLRAGSDAQLDRLADLLVDCVEGGASVSFMHPLPHAATSRRCSCTVEPGAVALARRCCAKPSAGRGTKAATCSCSTPRAMTRRAFTPEPAGSRRVAFPATRCGRAADAATRRSGTGCWKHPAFPWRNSQACAGAGRMAPNSSARRSACVLRSKSACNPNQNSALMPK